MKKFFLSLAFMATFMLMATDSQAQSWSDRSEEHTSELQSQR